jgi:hypothetical protein
VEKMPEDARNGGVDAEDLEQDLRKAEEARDALLAELEVTRMELDRLVGTVNELMQRGLTVPNLTEVADALGSARRLQKVYVGKVVR